jgi:DNA-binding response OmpR family regulator
MAGNLAVLSGKRILIVEDEALIALTMECEFQDAGAEIVGPAHDLATAIDLAGSEIDAAVLDINLSGDKVFPAARMLQSRGIPFVFASATCEEVTKQDGEFGGAVCFEKPLRLEDMVAAIEGLIGGEPTISADPQG